MKRWEYKVTMIAEDKLLDTAQRLEEFLNTSGLQGWEMVQAEGNFIVFKREKRTQVVE